MPCPQCQAITKDGTRCKRNTCVRYPLCFQHMKSIEGLEIKQSNIPNANLGLFATKEFPYNERNPPTITKYSSKQIENQENPDSDYVLKVGKKRYLDSKDKSNYAGRYINSYVNDPALRPANVRFTAGSRIYPFNNRYYVPIKQIRQINKGEELLIDYGRNYRL